MVDIFLKLTNLKKPRNIIKRQKILTISRAKLTLALARSIIMKKIFHMLLKISKMLFQKNKKNKMRKKFVNFTLLWLNAVKIRSNLLKPLIHTKIA